ncbi:MAG: HAD-IA family hydrolase [Dechloromonas sp.]|nr:HAD-IA family hydrolase [Dechloromonas sp.]
MFDAVLFDLDGTLADTAPDLAAALNRVRAGRGLDPVPLAMLRPHTSRGVRGLLEAGMAVVPGDPAYDQLAGEFLQHYAAALCVDTLLFAGMDAILDRLEADGIPWGIVTNKRARFTDPLVAALGLAHRAGCVVSGDTTAEAKPSPLPILHACRALGRQARATLYVGDDRRDIIAGQAAGTATAAAAYGYLGDSGPPETWNADHLVRHPDELAAVLFGR